MRTGITILSLFALLMFSGCQSNKNLEKPNEPKAEHTGNSVFEGQTNPFVEFESFSAQQNMYVYATRLRVRATPEIKDTNILGVLNTNDIVEIIDSSLELGDFVEIRIIQSYADIKTSNSYFTSKNYLSSQPMEVGSKTGGESDYFMIQNVATEIIRVYKKDCSQSPCNNKMVLEAEMVAGEDDSSTRTIVGNFHVTSWHKFYQDGAGSYPSWYHPDYPMPPKANSSVLSWANDKVLPYDGASVRGAFGWYAAKVGPNSSYQWTHGTIGWGADKKDFIHVTRGLFANLFSDPRSHGCSRTDNEAIAYIRELLPKGSRLIKVYAQEAYLDRDRREYRDNKTKKWDYILTKNGSQKDGQRSDRELVLSESTPRNEWLEEGTYTIDQFPDAEWFIPEYKNAKSGTNGNVYGLDRKEMQGVFLVDSGLLVDYQHPKSVNVGGYSDEFMPSYVMAPEDTRYYIQIHLSENEIR